MHLKKIVLLNILITIAKVKSQNVQTTPLVSTDTGYLVGLNFNTVQYKIPYSSYKGIPYAEPPINKNRFQPPQQKTPWTGLILNAFYDAPKCIQMDRSGQIVGSEDCLYLNVYTPQTNRFEEYNLKPVVVWIHGGAFSTGNGNSTFYGPDFLLEAELVVVSIQYRLGALGFLNLNHPNVSGNNGLKDQNLALKWIKRNIRNFGGDPDRITIMGQSAGGVSVDLHKLSNMSTGLFNQTISMSASPLCKYWAFQSNVEAIEQAYLLGKKFKVKKGDMAGLLKALFNASASDIVKKSSELPLIPFRPSLEKCDVDPEKPKFLIECTPKLYYEGRYNKGPHLMGFTSNEILSLSKSLDDLIKWHNSTAETVKSKSFAEKFPNLSNLLNKKFKIMADFKKNVFTDLTEFLSDIYFVTGIDFKQRLLSRNNQAPIYYYRYDFKSPESAHKSDGVAMLDGVSHEDELPHIFYRQHLNQIINFNDPSIALVRSRLVRLWSNFIRYGNPTPFGIRETLLENITWPDSVKDGVHLEITDKLTIKPRPTNSLVDSYQKSGFGDSFIFNDCKQSTVSNIINGLVNIPGKISNIIFEVKEKFKNMRNKSSHVVINNNTDSNI